MVIVGGGEAAAHLSSVPRQQGYTESIALINNEKELSQGYDQIAIRREMAKESFCAIYLRERVVIAADAVNRPGDFMVSKQLVPIE